MRKRVLKVCAALCTAGLLAGCGTTVSTEGGSGEALDINVTEMANELKSGLTFEDSLSELMRAWRSHIMALTPRI